MEPLECLKQLLETRGCEVDSEDENNLGFTARIAGADRHCVLYYDGNTQVRMLAYLSPQVLDRKQRRRLDMLIRYATLDQSFGGRLNHTPQVISWQIDFFICSHHEAIQEMLESAFAYLIEDVSRLDVILGLSDTSMGVSSIRKMVEQVGLVQGQA